MAGRLIFKFKAMFSREDAEGTTMVDAFGEPVGTRVELDPITISCQVEDPSYVKAMFTKVGLEKLGDVVIILHRKDLIRQGLLNTKGISLINTGTKVLKILDKRGNIVDEYPGMYVDEVRASSYGLNMGSSTRNIFFLICSKRRQT